MATSGPSLFSTVLFHGEFPAQEIDAVVQTLLSQGVLRSVLEELDESMFCVQMWPSGQSAFARLKSIASRCQPEGW